MHVNTVTLDTNGDWIEDDTTAPAPLPMLPTVAGAKVIKLSG